MSNFRDLTGLKFGKLTATKTAGQNNWGNFYWIFKCECGKTIKVSSGSVISGDTKTCGSSLCKESRVYWTYGKCLEVFKKCKSVNEVRLRFPPARAAAHRNGWLDSLYKEAEIIRQKQKNGYWTYKRCLEEFKKCKTLKEIREKCPTAQVAAGRHRGWLDRLYKEANIISERVLNGKTSSWNLKFGHLIRSAKQRNMVNELNIKLFKNICSQNCVYCDSQPKDYNPHFLSNGSFRIYKGHTTPTECHKASWIKINGIDRIDNSIGYTLENSVTCCWSCNESKLAKSFNLWCEHVERFQPGFTNKIIKKLKKISKTIPKESSRMINKERGK